MDTQTTLLIVGGVAVVAWLGGFLTRFGFPPPGHIAGTPDTLPTPPPPEQIPGAIAASQQKGLGVDVGQKTLYFPKPTPAHQSGYPDRITTAVGYSYAGYTSAPLTVA